MAPQRDEIFKQKVNDCVQHIILQKFTNFHAIRLWNFQNICNEIGWPRFFAPPCSLSLPSLLIICPRWGQSSTICILLPPIVITNTANTSSQKRATSRAINNAFRFTSIEDDIKIFGTFIGFYRINLTSVLCHLLLAKSVHHCVVYGSTPNHELFNSIVYDEPDCSANCRLILWRLARVSLVNNKKQMPYTLC